jgi:hypothetical protein
MRPWVERHGLGPEFDVVAGPWWTTTEVRFLGIRESTLVQLRRALD